MTTYNNIEHFKSTTDLYSGDAYNIAHDGSAIALGNEPSITNITLPTSWTFELVIKTSVITEQCILSIDDGSGGRFIDLIHRDGDKLLLFCDGAETIITHTTDPLPYTDWLYVTFGLTGGTLRLSSNGVTATSDPITGGASIGPTQIIRFFRPVHTENFFFNGIIDNYRLLNYFQGYYTYTGNVGFVANWHALAPVDPNNVSAGFTDSEAIEVSVASSGDGNRDSQRYNFFTQFYSDSVLQWDNRFSRLNFSTSIGGGSNIDPRYIDPRGLHHTTRTRTIFYTNGNLDKTVVGTGVSTNVSSTGTYNECRGDIYDRYIFGWKVAPDNSTNQLFRVDHEGLNEITVDTTTLFGTNVEIDTFTTDSDENRVFFRNKSTNILHCVDFDLTSNFTTFNLRLANGTKGGIDYANGYIYYGNTNPNLVSINMSIWRYHIETDAYEKIRFFNTFGRDQQIFVNRDTNTLVVSGQYFNKLTATDPDITFGKYYMRMRDRTETTVQLSWEAIDSAVGYKLYQDGVLITNTTDISFQVTGLSVNNSYKFTLEYTTDGTSYILNKFYHQIYHSVADSYYALPYPNDYRFNAQIGWVDPYTTEDILYSSDNNLMVKYNVATGTITEVETGSFGYGKNQRRVYSNKRIYFKYNNKIVDGGIELTNVTEGGGVSSFNNNGQYTVFDYTGDAVGDFDISLDGNKIYFSRSGGVHVYDKSTDTTTLLFNNSDGGSWGIRGVALDPLNQNSIVFNNYGTMTHLNISTGVSTDILPGTNLIYTDDLYVLGGVIYCSTVAGKYITLNVDGTNLITWSERISNRSGSYLDTINKRVIFFEQHRLSVISIPTMADLPADPSLFSVTPRPISLDLTWPETPGATSYTVEYTVGEEGASDIVITSRKATTRRRHSIRNLAFSSPYTVYLYYSIDDTDPSILVGSGTHYTTPNASGNYDRTSFESESGTGFSFSGLNQGSMQNLGEVMNELFSTGDEIEIDVSGTQRKTKFVRRGETTNVEEGASIAIPFVPSGGAGQNATLTLSDSTDVVVAFDETTQQITIDGNSYTPGQSLLIDGKKVTIYDI